MVQGLEVDDGLSNLASSLPALKVHTEQKRADLGVNLEEVEVMLNLRERLGQFQDEMERLMTVLESAGLGDQAAPSRGLVKLTPQGLRKRES